MLKDVFLKDYPAYINKAPHILKEELFAKWDTDNYVGGNLMSNPVLRETMNEIWLEVRSEYQQEFKILS